MADSENRIQCTFTTGYSSDRSPGFLTDRSRGRPSSPRFSSGAPRSRTGNSPRRQALSSSSPENGPSFRSRTAGGRTDGRRSAANAALFALLLVCICAFSLVFALEISSSSLPEQTLAAFRSAMTDGRSDGDGADNADDRPGRLHLVELESILTVFAPSDLPILPLPMDKISVEDDLTVKVFAPAGTEVLSVLPGTVKSVVPSEAGSIVTVSHAAGVELTFYGLADVAVERGQPVLQRTKLGVTAGEVLLIRVTKNGRPIDPTQFLGVGANLFG